MQKIDLNNLPTKVLPKKLNVELEIRNLHKDIEILGHQGIRHAAILAELMLKYKDIIVLCDDIKKLLTH
jgi:hypothetical protein